MNTFFFLLEISLYSFALYLLLKKKDLAIVYVPVLIFTYTVIGNHLIPSIGYYATISVLILASINRNASFFRHNIFSFFLALYFIILMFQVRDLVAIRPFLFAVMWFFISIPLIASIYKKHSREVLFSELSTAAFIILLVFVANVIFSTVFRYSTHSMYGISSGIMYGNLSATDFNIIAIASFIVLLKLLNKNNLLYLSVYVISLAFIMLSMRRSVMGICILGIAVLVLILISQKNVKKVFAYSFIGFLLGILIISNTNFLSLFSERYEMRKLDERELAEEKRFLEYELLYKDMFVYRDYSPIIGFELFNSWGNYGRGILDDRSLHGDLTSIAHSSGLLGVLLYLLMAATAFLYAFRATQTRKDQFIVFFCVIAFFAYTITGRYTEVGCMVLLFLLLSLPLADEEEAMNAIEKENKNLVKA